MPRYAAKADANQPTIVAGLRHLGASVTHLHMVGHGCPDIVVGFRGVNLLMEIKTEAGRLTRDERKWHQRWKGQAVVVRSVEEAIACCMEVGRGLAENERSG